MAGRISRLEVFALRGPKIARPHWTAHFHVPAGNELLVKLHTTGGLGGLRARHVLHAVGPAGEAVVERAW